MNDLRLPPDTPILYEEGLWELCTDRAYEMMVHKRQFLDKDTYDYQQNTGQTKFFKQTNTLEEKINETYTCTR